MRVLYHTIRGLQAFRGGNTKVFLRDLLSPCYAWVYDGTEAPAKGGLDPQTRALLADSVPVVVAVGVVISPASRGESGLVIPIVAIGFLREGHALVAGAGDFIAVVVVIVPRIVAAVALERGPVLGSLEGFEVTEIAFVLAKSVVVHHACIIPEVSEVVQSILRNLPKKYHPGRTGTSPKSCIRPGRAHRASSHHRQGRRHGQGCPLGHR